MRFWMALGLALTIFAISCAQLETPVDPNPGQVVPDFVTIDNLRYEARTAVLESFPVQLRTTVTLTNVGSRAKQVQFSDGCVVLLRAYASPQRTGDPAWDQARQVFCTMATVMVELQPGETRTFQARTDAAEILAGGLPPGLYHLTAFLRPDGRTIELNAGQADLAT